LFLIVVLSLPFAVAWSQMFTNSTIEPKTLVEKVLLDRFGGIEVTDVKYDGPKAALGYFSVKDDFLGFNKGIVVSTGNVADCKGPNNRSGAGSKNYYPGADEIDHLATGETHDGAILKFDFTPLTDEVVFEYVFASEEYPEFVDRGVNDVFALFIQGPGIKGFRNLAVIPGSSETVCVNNINRDKNSQYFINNPRPGMPYSTEAGKLFEFDGFTVPMTAKSKVEPYRSYQLVIVIADVGDDLFDSAIFLKSNSMRSNRPKLNIDFNQLEKVVASLDTLGAELEYNGDKSVLYFHLNINYKSNSSDIDFKYYSALDQIYEVLKSNFDVNITVIGHTDNVGNSQFNYRLSEDRAKLVAYYLIAKGVKLKRVDFEGKGSQLPIATNKTPEGRAQNRRVEFVFWSR